MEELFLTLPVQTQSETQTNLFKEDSILSDTEREKTSFHIESCKTSSIQGVYRTQNICI